jgi:hypothetical protein
MQIPGIVNVVEAAVAHAKLKIPTGTQMGFRPSVFYGRAFFLSRGMKWQAPGTRSPRIQKRTKAWGGDEKLRKKQGYFCECWRPMIGCDHSGRGFHLPLPLLYCRHRPSTVRHRGAQSI